jgi:DNA ligase D-like protein (predicted 3'-phosphoesterase)
MGELIRICAWCQKDLDVLEEKERSLIPGEEDMISHGMCEECYKNMMDESKTTKKGSLVAKAGLMEDVIEILGKDPDVVGKLRTGLKPIPGVDVNKAYEIFSKLESGKKFIVGDSGTSFGKTQVQIGSFLNTLAQDPNAAKVTGISSQEMRSFASEWKKQKDVLSGANWRRKTSVSASQVNSFMRSNPDKVRSRREGKVVRMFPNGQPGVVRIIKGQVVAEVLDLGALQSLGMNTSAPGVMSKINTIMQTFVTWAVVRNSLARVLAYQKMPQTHDKIMATFSSKSVNNNPALLALTDRVSQSNLMDKIQSVSEAVKRHGYDTTAPGAYNIYQLIGISNAGGVGAVENFLKTQKPFAPGYLTYLDRANLEIQKITNIPTRMPSSEGLGGFQARASLEVLKTANYVGPGVLYFPMQYAEDIKSGKRKITIRETDVPIQVAEIVKCMTYSGSPICDVRINSKNRMSVGRIEKAYGKKMAKELERKFGPDGQFTVIRFEPWEEKELNANDLEYGILNIQENAFEESGAITPAAQISNEGTEGYNYAEQEFGLSKESMEKLSEIWKMADAVGTGDYKKKRDEEAERWLEENAGKLGKEKKRREVLPGEERKPKKTSDPVAPESFRELLNRPLPGEERTRAKKKDPKAWYETEDLGKLSPISKREKSPKVPLEVKKEPKVIEEVKNESIPSPAISKRTRMPKVKAPVEVKQEPKALEEVVKKEPAKEEVQEKSPSISIRETVSELPVEPLSKRQEKSMEEIIDEEISSGNFVVLSPVQICEREGKWIEPCETIYKIRHLFEDESVAETSSLPMKQEPVEIVNEMKNFEGPAVVNLNSNDMSKLTEEEAPVVSKDTLTQIVENYDPNGEAFSNRFAPGTTREVVEAIANNPSISGEENLLDTAFADDDANLEEEPTMPESKADPLEIGDIDEFLKEIGTFSYADEGVELEESIVEQPQQEREEKKLIMGLDRLKVPSYTITDANGEEKTFELNDWPKLPEDELEAKKHFGVSKEVLTAFPVKGMKDGESLREIFKNNTLDLREILKNNPSALQDYILPFVINVVGKAWFDNNKSRRTLSRAPFGLWDENTQENLIKETLEEETEKEGESPESVVKSIKGGKRFEDTVQGKAIVAKINEVTTKYLNSYFSLNAPVIEMPAIDAFIYSYLDKDMRRWVANSKGYTEKKMVLCSVCRSEKFEGSIEPAMKKSEDELLNVAEDDDKIRRKIKRKYKAIDDKILNLKEQIDVLSEEDLESEPKEDVKKKHIDKKDTIFKINKEIEKLEKIKSKIEAQLSLPRDHGKMELIPTKTKASIWVCLNCERRAREISEEVGFVERKRAKLANELKELAEKQNKTEEEEESLVLKKAELEDLDGRNLQLLRDRKKYENQSRVPRVHTWCPNESCPGQRVPLTSIDWENGFWKTKGASEVIEKLRSQYDMEIPKHIGEQVVSQNLTEEEQVKGWDKKHDPPKWMSEIPFICPFDGVQFTLGEVKGQGYDSRAGYLWDPWQKTLWEAPAGEDKKSVSLDIVNEEGEVENEIGTKANQDEVYYNIQISELAKKVLILKYYQKRNDFIDSVSGGRYKSLETALGNKSVSGMFRELALYNSMLVFSSFDDLAYTGWLCNKTISKEKTKIGNIEVENRKLKGPQNKKEIQREGVVVPVLQRWVDTMLSSGKNWQEGFTKYNLLPWLVSEDDNGIKSKRENTFGTYFVVKLENGLFNLNLKDKQGKEPRILKILNAYKINKDQRDLLDKNELEGISDIKRDDLVSIITSGKRNLSSNIIDHGFYGGNILQDSKLGSGDYVLVHALVISGDYDHPAIKAIRGVRQENDEHGLFSKLGDLTKDPIFDERSKEQEIKSNFIHANISEEDAVKELAEIFRKEKNASKVAKEKLILEQYKYKQLDHEEALSDLVALGMDEKVSSEKLNAIETSDEWPEIPKIESERERAEFWLKLSKRVKKIEEEDGSWETPSKMAEEIKANVNKIISRSKERENMASSLRKLIEAQKGRLGEELFSQIEKLSKEVKEEIEFRKESPKEATAGLSVRADLSSYKQKRNFETTSEPEGKVEQGNKHRFVIQKHQATNLHFDLRLENNKGVLQSWAIPKHRMPTGKEKLLAVQTEDHPVEYAKFKGEIKEGYGKGKVEIVASGKYEPIEFSKDKIVFAIKSEKVGGQYSLIRTSGKKWLLMVAK